VRDFIPVSYTLALKVTGYLTPELAGGLKACHNLRDIYPQATGAWKNHRTCMLKTHTAGRHRQVITREEELLE
jgi:hypothetical protein